MAVIDPFPQQQDSVLAPSRNTVAVTPHDVNALPSAAKRLYVGATGDVVLRAVDSVADVTYKAVPTGAYISVRAAYVRATGTTATNILAEL
jgi:hypothetical protein